MREFILLALKAKTSPDFDINNLAGEGRLDLVCRTVSNALFLANDLRKDVIVHVALTGPKHPPKLVSFYGERLAEVAPDERAIALIIRKALASGLGLSLNEEKEVTPGVRVAKKAFETLVKEKSKTSQLLYLNMKGEDVRIFKFRKDTVFVLGDVTGLPRKTEKLLDRLGADKIKLGPKVLFASHCPVLVHNELDRREMNW